MKISIITVCYNSAVTLHDTIQSVCHQDYDNIEYIIVDGGSQDGSQAIAESYGAKINKLISEPDQGIYDAMNKGIACATGEVIALLNSDDVYAHTGVISTIARFFADPRLEVCFGDLVYFNQSAPESIVRYWRAGAFKPGAFAKGWSPPHPAFFVRRQVYERYGGFDLSYPLGNDVELMMRFLEKYRLNNIYFPEIAVKMRLGGISNRSIKNIVLQNLFVIRAARQLNIPLSICSFFVYKLLNRVSQFISKPKVKEIGR